VRNQRYCSKPACRAESKAQSQRRWQQRPENENYFRGPENRERVKDWRKRNPGYWRKKRCSIQVPLKEVFQAQAAAGGAQSATLERTGERPGAGASAIPHRN